MTPAISSLETVICVMMDIKGHCVIMVWAFYFTCFLMLKVLNQMTHYSSIKKIWLFFLNLIKKLNRFSMIDKTVGLVGFLTKLFIF